VHILVNYITQKGSKQNSSKHTVSSLCLHIVLAHAFSNSQTLLHLQHKYNTSVSQSVECMKDITMIMEEHSDNL